jgi:1-aminocyclopropane-1-carboxylate deaminase/D-cysteine desulfhydrase-like pyridoxal-dependent ACC family enzyme
LPLENLRDIPRVKLCNAASPLEQQHNLARLSGAKTFLMKRDDTNCFATGGNKARHMEYYLGDVMKKGADTFIMLGGRTPNLSRIAAAACAKYGIACHIVLEEEKHGLCCEPRELRDILASNMLNAHVHTRPPFESYEQAIQTMQALADKLEAEGRTPYILQNESDRIPIAAFGYIHAAQEIVEQLDELDQETDIIFCAAGSGNTVAGLLYGLRSLGCDVPVVGVSVGFYGADYIKQRIRCKLDQIAFLLDEENPVADDEILVTDEYCDHHTVTADTDPNHPATLAAKYEGLLIDPFFNSKSINAAFDYAKLYPQSHILLVNTGNSVPYYVKTKLADAPYPKLVNY